jgi:hypothetical protein
MNPRGLAQANELRVLHVIHEHDHEADGAIGVVLQEDMNALALDGSVPEQRGSNYRSGSLSYDCDYCAHSHDNAGSHSGIRSADVPHGGRGCVGVQWRSLGEARESGCLIQRKEDGVVQLRSVAGPLEHVAATVVFVALVAEEHS